MSKGLNKNVSTGARVGRNPTLASFLFWLLSFGVASSCNPNDSKQITVASSTKMLGSLDGDSLKKAGGSVRAFQVSADGTREAISGFSMNNGSFSVSIGSANFFSKPLASAPEEFAFMGYAIPDTHPIFKARFGDRAVGFARIELIGETAFVSEKQGVGYAQLLIPVSRRSLLSGDEPLELIGKDGGGLKLDDGVGRLKLTVKSKANQTPIEGASVTSIALKKNMPLLTPDDPNHGPIFQKTDVAGVADVFGLRVASGADPTVQLFASAEGFCHFVSEPEAFVPNGKLSRSVLLETCAGPDDAKPGRFRLDFEDDVNVVQSELSGSSESRGLVNQDKIKVKVLTASPILRPLRVLVFEGTKPEGKPRFETISATFSSALQVELPKVFNDGKSQGGAFLISIQSVFSDTDRVRYGAAPVALLYGIKSAAKPDVQPSDVTFRSNVGVEGIISGKAGSKFTLEYTKCESEGEIATWIGTTAPTASELIYQGCSGGPVQLTADQVGVVGTPTGGNRTAFVYYRDPFGNVNEIFLAATEGKKTVYVDYGAANLATQLIAFGSDLGFAKKADPKGTETQAFVFAAGLILTPVTTQEYVLRFANVASCRHGGPTSEDGTGSSDDRGNIISYFASSFSAEQLGKTTNDTKCCEDRSLTTLDIDFPDDPASNAGIYLRVRDLAGNVSSPFRQVIPPCTPGGGTTSHVCWKP